MLFCTVDVRKGGSTQHVTAGKVVSVPEIKILQAIHGADAVVNIKPFKIEADFDHEEERKRLAKLYEIVGTSDEGEARGLVPRLFGAFGPLPATLKAIGIDAKAEAERLRATAAAAAAAAAALEEEPELTAEEAAALDEIAAAAAIDEPEPVLEDDLV